MRVESVVGPDGEPDPAVLEAGSTISLSLQPFGVGLRQHWTSVIRVRERTNGTAYFRDTMADGPFKTWIHTHVFYADGDETILRDHVEYELLGPLDGVTAPFSMLGFEAMFRNRHQQTKAVLE